MYKGKERTYGALAAPLSPSASGIYSNPPSQGLLGSLQTQRNSLLLGLGMVAERPQTCRVPLFKASPSQRALNSLFLVSSDALTIGQKL